MKAVRAEFAVELVGGVVPVGSPCLTLGVRWELRSADGNGTAETVLTPDLRESVVGGKVAEADPFTGEFRCSFHI